MFKGKMLGEMGVMGGNEVKKPSIYVTTVKCVSQTGTLMYISKHEFCKLTHQPQVWNALREEVAHKKHIHKQTIKQTNKAKDEIKTEMRNFYVPEIDISKVAG